MALSNAPWSRNPRDFSLGFFAALAVTMTVTGCGDETSGGSGGAGRDAGADGTGGRMSAGGVGAMGGEGAEWGTGGATKEEPLPPPVPECPESTQGFATEVVSHEFGDGQDFGQDNFPSAVLGGPQGGGCCQGSFDVTALGDGGHVVLGFGPRTIFNGEGADFIVFENAFFAGGDESSPYSELARVAVSADGETWVEFPCEPGEQPPYGDCAGWRPTFANVLDEDAPSPWEVDSAGGDPYDLSDVGLNEARFVRITDVAGDDVAFDLDAVSVVNGRCD